MKRSAPAFFLVAFAAVVSSSSPTAAQSSRNESAGPESRSAAGISSTDAANTENLCLTEEMLEGSPAVSTELDWLPELVEGAEFFDDNVEYSGFSGEEGASQPGEKRGPGPNNSFKVAQAGTACQDEILKSLKEETAGIQRHTPNLCAGPDYFDCKSYSDNFCSYIKTKGFGCAIFWFGCWKYPSSTLSLTSFVPVWGHAIALVEITNEKLPKSCADERLSGYRTMCLVEPQVFNSTIDVTSQPGVLRCWHFRESSPNQFQDQLASLGTVGIAPTLGVGSTFYPDFKKLCHSAGLHIYSGISPTKSGIGATSDYLEGTPPKLIDRLLGVF